MSDVGIQQADPEAPLPACEVPGCDRHVWGSEKVCRPHLTTGVTAEKIEARRHMQEAARAIVDGGDTADVARKADLVALARELGVDVKASWKVERITAAIEAARTNTHDPVGDLANEDPAAPDADLMQAAQINGIPTDSDPVNTQEDNTNG